MLLPFPAACPRDVLEECVSERKIYVVVGHYVLELDHHEWDLKDLPQRY